MAKDKDDVLETAKKRFELSLENSEHNRVRAKGDIRFAAASPDDPWQWDDADVQKRKLHRRPMLTINKLPQHIRQVTNDIRQNRPSIKYRPADDNADVEVADILMGLARHIEANSDADIAYDFAAENQVVHGLGYIRVVSDYISEDSFDQDIYIKPVQDSFKCYDDPEAKDPAGADRKWFLIEDSLTKEDFEEQYPKAEAIDWRSNSAGDWFANDHVRIVEYFEVTYKTKKLNQYAGGQTGFEGDKLPQGVMPGEAPVKSRSSQKCVVMWYKLNGQEILEKREFPCKHIPIARVIGNSWIVDGKTYLSGIVRNAKDSQRMYNVAQSAIVERVMLAPKAPFVGSIEAIEGYENVWATANTDSHAILPFNAFDGEGNPLQRPERVAPAQIETGLSQIAQSSSDDIKNETGQYDASLGQKSNETSGKAIMARQREGDTATFHYVDNLARAVRHIGRIILDMIPQVYDSRRVARILGEDGSPANAVIDTEHPEALTEMQDDAGDITRIFNPTIGKL
jgi:Phage P22-like portal protein